MVEDVFRSMKSLLTRGRFFTSATKRFAARVLLVLALLLRKELEDRLAHKEWKLEWPMLSGT